MDHFRSVKTHVEGQEITFTHAEIVRIFKSWALKMPPLHMVGLAARLSSVKGFVYNFERAADNLCQRWRREGLIKTRRVQRQRGWQLTPYGVQILETMIQLYYEENL